MKRGKEFNIINKCVAFVFVFLFGALNSFATENSLAGVDIKQSANNGYQVFLKLDKKAQIQKVIDNSDNITLMLKGTLPSETMEIIYDSEDNLSNVIVQKRNDDNTLISLQGKDIANAEIYTKELSTGSVKELDTNTSLLSGLFFIADKKILGTAVTGMFLLFLMMLASRPKNRKNTANNSNKTAKSKNNSANTLRNKNLVQSRNIPSINYRVNGSFNSANATMPKDFVVNNQKQTIREQQIRKAG
ncbi:MAG: hypothetical protein IJY61_05875 [Candidatus Gastranaerophilales bacterium]|nr:hypothetical protein [Candidatus Gastranaerophilales bacterium]